MKITRAEVERAALMAGVAVTDDEAEMIALYLSGDEQARADIEAFHESGGPEMIRKAKKRHEEDTP